MTFNRNTKVALLAGILAGVVIGAKSVQTSSTPAFMGVRPDEAIRMENLKWMNEDDPKFRSAAMRPRENFVELEPAPIWFGPAKCRQFHLGPRYTKCLLSVKEVKPTPLPYPDKSN